MLRTESVPDNSEPRTWNSKLRVPPSRSLPAFLVRPCLTVSRFPPLGSPVLIEIYAIAYASRVPCQEFVVPHFASCRKFLEPLGVAEFTD